MGFRNAIHGIRPGTVGSDELADDAVGEQHLQFDAITAKHTLTGPLIRTDVPGNRRWELSSLNNNELRGIDLDTAFSPAVVRTLDTGTQNLLSLIAGMRSGTGTPPYIQLSGPRADGTNARIVYESQVNGHDYNGELHPRDGIRADPAANGLVGRRLTAWNFDGRTYSFDAAGECLGVAHGLGRAPIAVVTMENPLYRIQAVNYTATTMDFWIRDHAGAIPPAANRRVDWIALA